MTTSAADAIASQKLQRWLGILADSDVLFQVRTEVRVGVQQSVGAYCASRHFASLALHSALIAPFGHCVTWPQSRAVSPEGDRQSIREFRDTSSYWQRAPLVPSTQRRARPIWASQGARRASAVPGWSAVLAGSAVSAQPCAGCSACTSAVPALQPAPMHQCSTTD